MTKAIIIMASGATYVDIMLHCLEVHLVLHGVAPDYSLMPQFESALQSVFFTMTSTCHRYGIVLRMSIPTV